MKVELIFALMGGIVGATIAQLKGQMIASRVVNRLPERVQKLLGSSQR